MHCDRPPCVGVCPKKGKATRKSTEGVSAGLVLIDYAECIRCDKCIKVCPYKARSRDQGVYYSDLAPFVPKYEKRPSGEYGRKWPNDSQGHPPGTARKCHFCLHRIAVGMLPVCTTTCIGRATHFGDLNDPDSLIAKVKKANTVVTIRSVSDPDFAVGRVSFGGIMNQPRVYYILDESHGGK
jgi:molybdopterin-containing oxidoreductase family iron-sulfur binding subunit